MTANYSFNISGYISVYRKYNKNDSTYNNVIDKLFNITYNSTDALTWKETISLDIEDKGNYEIATPVSLNPFEGRVQATVSKGNQEYLQNEAINNLMVFSAKAQAFVTEKPEIIKLLNDLKEVFADPIKFEASDLISLNWNFNGRQNLVDLSFKKNWYDRLETPLHVGAYIEIYQEGDIFFKGIIHSIRVVYSLSSGTPEFSVLVSCEGLDGVLARTKIYYNYINSRYNIGGTAFLTFLGMADNIKPTNIIKIFPKVIYFGLTSNQFIYFIPSKGLVANISSEFEVRTEKVHNDYYLYNMIASGGEDINMSIMDYINTFLLLPDYEMFIYPDGKVNYNRAIKYIDTQLKDFNLAKSYSSANVEDHLPLNLVSDNLQDDTVLYYVYHIDHNNILSFNTELNLVNNYNILRPNILSFNNDTSFITFANTHDVSLFTNRLGLLNSLRGGLNINNFSWQTAWEKYNQTTNATNNSTGNGVIQPKEDQGDFTDYMYSKSRFEELYYFNSYDTHYGRLTVTVDDITHFYPGNFLRFNNPISKNNEVVTYRINNVSGIISFTDMTSIANVDVTEANLPNIDYLSLMKAF